MNFIFFDGQVKANFEKACKYNTITIVKENINISVQYRPVPRLENLNVNRKLQPTIEKNTQYKHT